jgi:hypothetical protein
MAGNETNLKTPGKRLKRRETKKPNLMYRASSGLVVLYRLSRKDNQTTRIFTLYK